MALLLAACGFGDALESDPSAWHPPVLRASSPTPDTDAAAPPPACDEEPPFDPTLSVSAASALSHATGQPCLEGCHEPGGTARKVFAAAGSAYRAQGQRAPAPPGSLVRGVGGVELPVDLCGNFYATRDELVSSPGGTQPWVAEPIVRRMQKSLSRVNDPGDCNGSGCHDFGGTLRSGIYF